MSLFHDSALVGASGQGGAAGYLVERSLRFNSSDSAYLSRVPSTAGNRKTWTFACWLKGSVFNSQNIISTTGTTNADFAHLYFNSEGQLTFGIYTATILRLSAVSRDPSAWFHIVLSFDSTQATAASRVKIYLNGVEQTSFSVDQRSTISQNTDYGINSTNTHAIGRQNQSGAGYLDGYLADLHLIDGQALTPSSFTEVSATTGQLIPKAYTGTFTGNSFWLKFADNSAATATTLGKDSSGLGNNWTPNNLSVTAGVGNDSLVDTPTSYGTDTGAGGEVRGNYCTLNPLINASYNTYSNGNLECAFPGATTGATAVGTLAVSSGKWYWELNRNDISAGLLAGIARIDTNTLNLIGSNATSYAYKDSNGNKINNGTSTAYGATWNHTNIIGVALDLDAGTLVFYKDGVSQGTAFSGLSGTFYPVFSEDNAGSGSGVATNFGQRPFAYPVSGFKALCDTNLPAPVVAKPSTVMDVVTYNGSSGTKTITMPGGFSPDLVWIKNRGQARWHSVFDQVRGVYRRLFTNATNAEANDVGFNLDSFTSTGFTLLDTDRDTNSSAGDAYVAWCWDAGSSTVTNTQGSITSQVRTNGYLSIVSYTAAYTGSARTVGHGLGVKPSLIILKNRSDGSANWRVYHSASGASLPLILNSTAAAASNFGIWDNTEPTSSVFTVGINTDVGGNIGSGDNLIAYCFAPVAGYSSFGSYTGNGSADGPFVYTGFRPRWVMIKRSDSASISYGWFILDTARNTYNVMNTWLAADSSAADGADVICDTLANGFKIRTTAGNINTNASTFVYACFAESPLQYARAR